MTELDPRERLVTAGVDVGSSAVKVAVLQEDGAGGSTLLSVASERIRRRDPLAVAEEAFARALSVAAIGRADLAYVATTGEGESVPFRTGHFYGMTTHARGGLFLDPPARAVIDVGALHARAVTMDDRGKVLGYRMTSQCASGSGQFLENITRYLGITLEEIGPLSQRADDPEAVSSVCAVLAETDVINMVSRGISVPNILKGIHLSMAGRLLRLVRSAGADGRVVVTGGLAADSGLLAALTESAGELGIALELVAHPDSTYAGALGAGIWGAYRQRKLAGRV